MTNFEPQAEKQSSLNPSTLPEKRSGGWKVFGSALLVAGLFGLDQATKLWTVRHLELGGHIFVLPKLFHWVHFSNTGAAFGMFQNQNHFFIGLSIVALGGLGFALARGVFPGRLNRNALLFLMAGVLGNLTDRFLHGYVVDFLLFDLGIAPANPWPAFNVADSCIFIAVVCLLLASVLEECARRQSLKKLGE